MMYSITVEHVTISSKIAPVPRVRIDGNEVHIVGMRAPAAWTYELSALSLGCPALYFRLTESHIYCGKAGGKDGVYGRHKAHSDSERIWINPIRASAKEVLAVWDETKQLTQGELKALEAAYILHISEDGLGRQRSNKNVMKIAYTEDVREEYLWSTYQAIRLLLHTLEIASDKTQDIFYWFDTCLLGNEIAHRHFKYLTDRTRIPDTVVIHASPEEFSVFALQNCCWPGVPLLNTRHRRVRFIAFYRPDDGLVTHFARIQSKKEVSKNTSSGMYDLTLATPALRINPVRILKRNTVTPSKRQYVLLEDILVGKNTL